MELFDDIKVIAEAALADCRDLFDGGDIRRDGFRPGMWEAYEIDTESSHIGDTMPDVRFLIGEDGTDFILTYEQIAQQATALRAAK